MKDSDPNKDSDSWVGTDSCVPDPLKYVNMDEQFRQLEIAAEIVLAPPTVVLSDERCAAEEIFASFRRTPSPYQLCSRIIETSNAEFVLFEAAKLIENAILRETPDMASPDIIAVRDLLIQHITKNFALTSVVRRKYAQVVATIIRVLRYDSDDSAEAVAVCIDLLNRVCELISDAHQAQKLVGCEFFSVLIQDEAFAPIASIRQQTTTGFWDEAWNCRVKAAFEMLLSRLEEALNDANSSQQLVKQLLSLIVDLLIWNPFCEPHSRGRYVDCLNVLSEFLTEDFLKRTRSRGRFPEIRKELRVRSRKKRIIGADDEYPKPFDMWKEVLCDPEIVNFFFRQVYVKVCEDSESSQYAVSCLVMVACSCIKGPLWMSAHTNLKSRSCLVLDLCWVLDRVKVMDKDAVGFATIILLLSNNTRNFPDDIRKKFADLFITFMCFLEEHAAEEENLRKEGRPYLYAFSLLLNAYRDFHVEFPVECDDEQNEYYTASARKIVETYIMCHLSPPIGVRVQSWAFSTEDCFEFKDENIPRFSQHLVEIGDIARRIPGVILPLVSGLLERYTSQLHTEMQTLSPASENMSLDRLSEDIHWLLVISGHIITDLHCVLGGTPTTILKHSEDQSDSVDITATLRLLTSPDQNFEISVGQEVGVDDVVRLVAGVFRLCELERRAVEANLGSVLGSRLGCSLMWFLQKFLKFFFLIHEDSQNVSCALREAFMSQTQASSWIVDFVFRKIKSNFENRSKEPRLLEETITVLFVILDKELSDADRSRGFQLLLNSPVHVLSQEIVRNYHECLVYGVRRQKWLGDYAKQTFDAALAKLITTVEHENFLVNFCTENKEDRTTVIFCLNVLAGLVLGVQEKTVEETYSDDSVVPFLFGYGSVDNGCADELTPCECLTAIMFLKPLLSNLPSLFELGKNSPEVLQACLELLVPVLTKREKSVARKLYVSLPTIGHSYKEIDDFLLTICSHVLDTWNSINLNQWDFSPTTEEDPTRAIELMLRLVRSMCDFRNLAKKSDDYVEMDTAILRMVITGLFNVASVFDDIYLIPSVTGCFFGALTSLCEWKPEEVSFLPENIFGAFVSVFEMCLSCCKSDITYDCSFCLNVISGLLRRPNAREKPIHNHLRPLLKVVFEEMMIQIYLPIDSGLSSSFVMTGFSLYRNFFTAYKDAYREAVKSVMASQPSEAEALRLQCALESLISS